MATKKVDSLGRVVIPRDIRDKLNIIDDVTCFDIEIKGSKIVMSKAKTMCPLCGSNENVLPETHICESCAAKIADEYEHRNDAK